MWYSLLLAVVLFADLDHVLLDVLVEEGEQVCSVVALYLDVVHEHGVLPLSSETTRHSNAEGLHLGTSRCRDPFTRRLRTTSTDAQTSVGCRLDLDMFRDLVAIRSCQFGGELEYRRLRYRVKSGLYIDLANEQLLGDTRQ